jgi:hypothetical protein
MADVASQKTIPVLRNAGRRARQQRPTKAGAGLRIPTAQPERACRFKICWQGQPCVQVAHYLALNSPMKKQAIGIVVGVVIGVAMGAAFDNIVAGIGIGLALGIAMGPVLK